MCGAVNIAYASAPMRTRLSIIMFLQYFCMGAVLPILPLYLRDYLGAPPEAIGYVMAMPALASFIAPLVAARIADRVISAERLMALLHLGGGALMFALSFQSRWDAFLINYLAYALVFIPTAGLSNTVAFHHIEDAKRNFGAIRVWGTIGWIAVAWTFGFFWVRGIDGHIDSGRLPHMLYVSAGASIALGLYMLFLPVADVKDVDRPRASMRRAVRVLFMGALAPVCIATFFGAISNTFYMQWSSPYLRQIGFSEGAILPVLSAAQAVEIFTMAFLGRWLALFGYRKVMLAGVVAVALRMALLAFVPNMAVAVFAVMLHGVSWSCYFTAAYIYVDEHCNKEDRAAAQQLYHMMFSAFGTFTGSLVAGNVAAAYQLESGDIAFTWVWCVPLAVSAGAFLILYWGLRHSEPIQE